MFASTIFCHFSYLVQSHCDIFFRYAKMILYYTTLLSMSRAMNSALDSVLEITEIFALEILAQLSLIGLVTMDGLW